MKHYTDDECIAIAELHGAGLFQSDNGRWYTGGSINSWTTFDDHCHKANVRNHELTRASTARRYCQFHNLLR